tara:strand:- start:765 stop:920 length:156 start_codon:yes stop_codon:yes gene_type:complete
MGDFGSDTSDRLDFLKMPHFVGARSDFILERQGVLPRCLEKLVSLGTEKHQ